MGVPMPPALGCSPTIGPVIRLRPLALILLPMLVLAGCGSSSSDASSKDGSKASSPASSPSASDTGASSTGDCSYSKDGSQAAKKAELPPTTAPASDPKSMTITTSAGPVKVSFDPDKTPCTVNSFVSLAKQGYFDDTKCHRLTTSGGLFVLQCGDPSATGRGGPGYSFPDELVKDDPRLQPCQDMSGQQVCTYPAGTVAMANAGPDTNGSQFFLVYKNSFLPNSYAVFGHMDAQGLQTVQKIAAGGSDPSSEAPKSPANIVSVK